MIQMGRKKQGNKRKKDSDSDNSVNSTHNKVSKIGGASGLDSTDTDIDVSVIIQNANSSVFATPCIDTVTNTSTPKSDCFNDSVEQNLRVKHNTNPPVGASSLTMANNSSNDNSDMAARVTPPGSVPTNADIIAHLSRLESKITSLDRKLEKLDSLENKVNNFDSEMKKMWLHVTDSCKKTDSRITTVEDRVDSVEFSTSTAQETITRLETENDKLKQSMVYLQSQSMRNNLLFSGIPEIPSEKPDDTERIVRRFMCDKLQMASDLVGRMKIERAHRMGEKSQRYDRKIVCKFNQFADRETVRKLSSKLKGTSFYINEQFPIEVNEKRRKLVPKMNAAKRDGKRAWISYDTLYIDGVAVKDA